MTKCLKFIYNGINANKIVLFFFSFSFRFLKKNLFLHCWKVVPLFICIIFKNFQSNMSINSSRIVRLLGLYHTEETIAGTNSVPGIGCQVLGVHVSFSLHSNCGRWGSDSNNND